MAKALRPDRQNRNNQTSLEVPVFFIDGIFVWYTAVCAERKTRSKPGRRFSHERGRTPKAQPHFLLSAI
jgi:hypothetical protein